LWGRRLASQKLDGAVVVLFEAPALIHFGQDRTEQWLLVRLKQPHGSQNQGS
jgi:hypothetical protein